MDCQRSFHNWCCDTDRSCFLRYTRIHNSILRTHYIQFHTHNHSHLIHRNVHNHLIHRNVRNYRVHHTHSIHRRRYQNRNHLKHIHCHTQHSPLMCFHHILRNPRNHRIHSLYIPDCSQCFRNSRTWYQKIKKS